MKKTILFLVLFLFVGLKSWADVKVTDWMDYSLNLQLWDTQFIDGQNVSIVRRAENKFTFKLDPKWSAVVMLDPAKVLIAGKDDSWLQDAILLYKINKSWSWQVGEFKIPVSEEGIRSAAKLDTIERAQFNLGGNKFGDLRELGTMATFQDEHILAQFGAFSGDPTNQSVGATIKEGAARFVYSPDKHFHFGGSLSRGSRHNVDKPLDQLELSDKNALEFMWDEKPWNFEAEWVNGRLDVPTVTGGVVTAVTPTTREGWYAKLRYDINNRWQAVLRDDAVFTNVDAPSNGERDLTAGITYWFLKDKTDLRTQINYVNRVSFSSKPVPSLWRADLILYF